MPTSGQRSAHRSQGLQIYRLQLALDLAYLLSSLFLAGLIGTMSDQPVPAACMLLAFGPAVVWGILLYRRASIPHSLLAKFPLFTWAVVKAVALGATLSIASLTAAGGSVSLQVGPWVAAGLNSLILLLEIPYLSIYRPKGEDSRGGVRKVLVVGSGERAASFIKHMERSRVPVEVSGIIGRNSKRVGKSILGVPVIGLVHDLPQILRSIQVDEVVFLLSRMWMDLVEQPMLVCERAGVRVLLSTDVYPFRLSSPRIEEMGDFQLLAFEPHTHSELGLSIKAVMDVVLAAIFMVMGAPLFALISLIVKLSSPGPVLFKQVRAGLNGRKFMMWKFRTMVPEAEELKPELAPFNESDGPTFKMTRDPRVTAFGRFLRRTSLDELPQFYNVLRGEMSLVGPRPAVPEEVEKYDNWQRRRLSVKPGLTCIWQTSGRNKVSFDEWMRMDLHYIENWSLRLDIKLLFKTIPAVLLATGS
jgi:exopolysaccharide biosynthesis polyprenyl glycosylphosphotransferase